MPNKELLKKWEEEGYKKIDVYFKLAKEGKMPFSTIAKKFSFSRANAYKLFNKYYTPEELKGTKWEVLPAVTRVTPKIENKKEQVSPSCHPGNTDEIKDDIYELKKQVATLLRSANKLPTPETELLNKVDYHEERLHRLEDVCEGIKNDIRKVMCKLEMD
jgi:hypothetical protein